MVLHAATRRLFTTATTSTTGSMTATLVRTASAAKRPATRALVLLPSSAQAAAAAAIALPRRLVFRPPTPLVSPTRPSSTDASTNGAAASAASTTTEPPHFKLVLPDMGQTTKTGKVTAWRKEEGDMIKNGDVVCEVEMDEFTVGMEIDDKGYLARILVPAGTDHVPVGEPLAVLVYEEKDLEAFNHLAPYHAAGGGGVEGELEEIPVDGTSVLKFLHKLVRNGSIKDKEFAKKLQALARHEDAQLLRIFEASFEGNGPRREEDFDLEFFLEECRGRTAELDQETKT